MKTLKTTPSEPTGTKPTDYDAVSPADWAEYEFATIEYDYKIHPDAAKRIRGIFRRYIAAEQRASETSGEACKVCGGSGFAGYGTGYGDVCPECGGQRYFPRISATEQRARNAALEEAALKANELGRHYVASAIRALKQEQKQ